MHAGTSPTNCCKSTGMEPEVTARASPTRAGSQPAPNGAAGDPAASARVSVHAGRGPAARSSHAVRGRVASCGRRAGRLAGHHRRSVEGAACGGASGAVLGCRRQRRPSHLQRCERVARGGPDARVAGDPSAHAWSRPKSCRRAGGRRGVGERECETTGCLIRVLIPRPHRTMPNDATSTEENPASTEGRRLSQGYRTPFLGLLLCMTGERRVR